MEITRLQPFPLAINHPGFTPETEYVVTIMDDHASDLWEGVASSDANGVLSIDLPDYFARYDDEYRLEIYEFAGTYNDDLTAVRGDIVMIDTLTIMRPYVDPDVLAETPEDMADAIMYEAIARAIINSITGGFMYKREVVETVGQGADYLSIPYRLNKIIRVYENDVLVYDAEDPNFTNVRTYQISPDRATITVSLPTANGVNRHQSKPVRKPRGASDSFTLYNTNDSPNYSDSIYDTKTFVDMAGNSAMFPEGWDYTVVIEAGWPIIPQDIKQAAMLIINDLKCNNIPYINSYIKDYKSDQFTLTFDPAVFKDTGNRIADKILSAYVRPIYRLGVL